MYWRLIYAVAVKSGLRADEAEEVVQETVLSAAKKMNPFVYEPEVCSFKGWLKQVTRLRILDQFRKRGPRPMASSPREGTSSRTSTVERVPDSRNPM